MGTGVSTTNLKFDDMLSKICSNQKVSTLSICSKTEKMLSTKKWATQKRNYREKLRSMDECGLQKSWTAEKREQRATKRDANEANFKAYMVRQKKNI